jgi:hypothetical protein
MYTHAYTGQLARPWELYDPSVAALQDLLQGGEFYPAPSFLKPEYIATLVRIYTYIHTYIHTCINTYINTCIHTNTYIHTCVCVCVCVCVYTHTHTHMHACICMHVCMYVYTHTHTHTQVRLGLQTTLDRTGILKVAGSISSSLDSPGVDPAHVRKRGRSLLSFLARQV